jgi:carboxyl-terminal processing protease
VLRFLRSLIFVLLILSTLSCLVVTRAFDRISSGSPPSPTSPAITQPPEILLTSSPTPSPSPSPTATLTPSPSPAPTETPTPTIVITPSSRQLSIFQELWDIVNESYLYADFNGLDWDAVYEEYSRRIEAGITDEDFYLAMDEMIFRLGDEHSVFLSPQEVLREESEFSGNNDYVGIGALIIAVPERDRASILITFPGSPADHAGLQSHDNILAVDGEAILEPDGSLKDIVRGPQGSPITLTVQTPGEEPRQQTLVRQQISGPVPVPYRLIDSPAGQRIGYILLVTFNDTTIDDQVEEALQAMSREGELDGVILDNRQNSGGADTVLRGTLAYFTGGTLGYFISRERERPLEVKSQDVSGSLDLPLVVLVGSGTASYGEVFSGILKDQDRAYLIGETTDGNVETLWGFDFKDGSRAWLAYESFRPFHHPNEDWEEIGVIPHQTVMTNWDEVTLENDPAIDAALIYLGGN